MNIPVVVGKITLTHDEIKHLTTPPMTLVFQVTDPELPANDTTTAIKR
ncbi:MAG: copper-binding protein [Burkholderiaceae bacterium]